MRLSPLELFALVGAAATVLWVGCDFIVLNDAPTGLGWSVDTSTGYGAGTAQGGGGGAGPGGQGTGLACCATCHGTPENPAPPPDFAGKDDPSLPTVGAHSTHNEVGVQTWHAPIDCDTCHTSPTNCSERQEGDHLNDERDVVFIGPLVDGATYDNTTDPARPTCKNTWCHGSFLGEDLDGQTATHREPVWTDSSGVYGRPSACGKACHTLPPKTVASTGDLHPVQAPVPCEGCHSETIAAFNVSEPAFSTWVDNGAYHIDGEVTAQAGGAGPGGTGGAGGGGGSGGAGG